MENPLDNAGDAVETVGQGISGLLHGTARFLEQLTGNATYAAVFAGFLLLGLSLIKAGATSRNTYIYGRTLRRVTGIVLVIGLCLNIAQSTLAGLFAITTDWVTEEKRLSFLEGFFMMFRVNFHEYRWYVFVLAFIWIVARFLEKAAKPDHGRPQQISSEPPG